MTEKKLIHFNSDSDYQDLKNDIDGNSIVFVKDSHKIATHGAEYLFLGWSILEPLLFPMYLKTELGSGNYRTRTSDTLSLWLLDFFNKNKKRYALKDYFINLESLDYVLYIDEFLVTEMIQVQSDIIALIIPSISGTAFNYLFLDGSIQINID